MRSSHVVQTSTFCLQPDAREQKCFSCGNTRLLHWSLPSSQFPSLLVSSSSSSAIFVRRSCFLVRKTCLLHNGRKEGEKQRPTHSFLSAFVVVVVDIFGPNVVVYSVAEGRERREKVKATLSSFILLACTSFYKPAMHKEKTSEMRQTSWTLKYTITGWLNSINICICSCKENQINAFHVKANSFCSCVWSEEVFWSQKMQRRRHSLSIESVVHETGRRCHWKTGQRGTGRDIFRHTALGQMSQYLKRVWGCPTSIPSLTLFTINFHFLQMSYQLSRLSMSQYLWHPF